MVDVAFLYLKYCYMNKSLQLVKLISSVSEKLYNIWNKKIIFCHCDGCFSKTSYTPDFRDTWHFNRHRLNNSKVNRCVFLQWLQKTFHMVLISLLVSFCIAIRLAVWRHYTTQYWQLLTRMILKHPYSCPVWRFVETILVICTSEVYHNTDNLPKTSGALAPNCTQTPTFP